MCVVSLPGSAEMAVDFVATNASVEAFYAHEGFQPLLATYARRLGNSISKNGWSGCGHGSPFSPSRS